MMKKPFVYISDTLACNDCLMDGDIIADCLFTEFGGCLYEHRFVLMYFSLDGTRAQGACLMDQCVTGIPVIVDL